jgi:hypothetical protein
MVMAVATAPGYGRLVSSAQSFQQHFRDLNKAGNSLSPIERLVFSLVMANSGRRWSVPLCVGMTGSKNHRERRGIPWAGRSFS